MTKSILPLGLAFCVVTTDAWTLPQAPPTPTPPPARVAPAGLDIDHKAVGCIVAEQYPRLEACFAPSDGLGRAQVQFRAAKTSAWYAVDMKPDGPCFSTFLPKPKRETTSIDYFVFAVDKQFVESQRPEKAPDAPYQPRVVRKKSECEPLKVLAAWSSKTAPRIVVSVVRDAGGKVLDAAAQAGAPVGLAGFSSDGVVVANASTGGSAASSSPAAGKSAGHHVPVLAIAGGVALAGGAVAIAAGGGGNSTGGGGSNPPSNPGSTPPPATTLSGTWAGSAAAQAGLLITSKIEGGFNCLETFDVEANLVQNGNTLSGPASFTLRTFACEPTAPNAEELARSIFPPFSNGALSGALSPPSAITVTLGQGPPLTGTYTSTLIRATAGQASPGITADYTLTLSKR